MVDKWTTKLVADRLDEAARTLRRLPSGRPKACKAFWPQIIYDAMEAYGWNEPVLRLGPPTPEAIARMDETLEWLRWLEPENIRLVWLRAERMPWKEIMHFLGMRRTTAWYRWKEALQQLATQLNTKTEKSFGNPERRKIV